MLRPRLSPTPRCFLVLARHPLPAPSPIDAAFLLSPARVGLARFLPHVPMQVNTPAFPFYALFVAAVFLLSVVYLADAEPGGGGEGGRRRGVPAYCLSCGFRVVFLSYLVFRAATRLLFR